MKEVLIPLQAYLLGRTGSTVAGLILLLSLVWWGGPYVGVPSETGRLAIMAGIVLLALAIWIGRRLLLRRRAAQFSAELQKGGEGSTRQLEIEELREKMCQAIDSLKASGLGGRYRGQSALYALPWFMIIGPAAAGKTTLLRSSGLHFPYAQGDDIDIKGFGGTRNCDWWFADEAVLLDTAGRYTTEEENREEWLAFLGLLRKYRSRAPVNGILVAVSLADLLTADDARLDWHVKVIRDRLDELIRHLGCLFPVYLVVTKCDLLHGFTAFFEDLSEQERQQVWGAWLLQPEGIDLAGTLREKLAELHGRLCELRLRKLSLQRNLARKGELFDFPAQFAIAAERLQQFFTLLAKTNPYQETPNFCGLYLTSGAQEGTPLQRIVGSLRQAFGYREESPERGERTCRSFFIRKFFQEVVFPNARGNTRNRHRDRLNRWLKGAWVTASLAVIVGTFFLLSASFTSNALLAHQGREAVQSVEKAVAAHPAGAPAVFRALLGAQQHYRQLLAYQERLPLHLWFGVYKGDTQIRPFEAALLAGLERTFFQPAATALEYRLENFGRQWETADEKGQERIREPYYQALRTYLMVARPERLRSEEALPLLTELCQEELRRQGGQLSAGEEVILQQMIGFFLGRLQPAAPLPTAAAWLPKESIIETARNHLRAPPEAARLYAQVLHREYPGAAELRLAELVRGDGAGLLTGSAAVPWIYTATGWQESVAAEIHRLAVAVSRGDWVIGPDLPAAAEAREESANPDLALSLEREIRRLYFADYAEHWFTFLEGVRFAPFQSLPEASRQLQLVARSDGPLAELMRAVSVHLAPLDAATAEGERQPGPVAELDELFGDLRKFADPAEKMTVSLLLNQYLLALSSVQNEMERLSAAVDVPRESCLYAARLLGGGGDLELYKSHITVASMLNGIEPRTRRLADSLLSSAIRHCWAAVLREAGKDLQQQWRNAVVGTYARKLRGKFPLTNGSSDAALADIADFFRPQEGVFWSFVRGSLTPFVTEGRGEWRQKTWLDLGAGFSREALTAIARSSTISASLFRRGSEEPQIDFYLYPVPAKGISETLITTNGQEYRYRNEPQEWRKFSWPGEASQVGARVSGVAGRALARAELNADGIWGLFHLLRQARITQESSTEYLSTWELEGTHGVPVTVRFRIRADRANSLFDRQVLTGFDLPENLF